MAKKTGLVLYYGLLDQEQESLLLTVLDDFSLLGCRVGEQQVHLSIAELLGLAAEPAQKTDNVQFVPEKSILLLYQLEDDLIRDLLLKIRQAGLALDLKAVVTKHNIKWSLAQLAVELQREDIFMRQLAGLDRMVQQAEQLLSLGQNKTELARAAAAARVQLDLARSGQELQQDSFLAAGRQLAALLQAELD